MHKHYPGESIPSKDFYPMVGKIFSQANKDNPDAYSNTCAARMSYALNRAGLRLPVAPDGGSLKGDDGLNYWLRVKQLENKLFNQFGKPDIELRHKLIEKMTDEGPIKSRIMDTQDFLAKIKPKKGVVVFEVKGWKDAAGHFTLWDGKDLAYVGDREHNNINSWEYYFFLLRNIITPTVRVQTTRVIFWELK